MKQSAFCWESSLEIATALMERYPGLNMMSLKNSFLLERLKTLAIYDSLPALPTDEKEKRRLLQNIKQAYVVLYGEK